MGYSYNFIEDLKVARKKEVEAFLALIGRFKELEAVKHTVHFNNDNKYDFSLFTHKLLTFEAKHDDMSNGTGNIAIEFECRGKPSGISVTEALWWIQCCQDGFYMLTTALLKQRIRNIEYSKTVVGGDPGSNTYLYLFKAEDFKNRAFKL